MIENLQLSILAGPGRDVNPHLMKWSTRIFHKSVVLGPSERKGIPEAKNGIVRTFLEGNLPWLLLADDDTVPIPDTEELLACQADVCAAEIVASSGRIAHPHTISCAFLKMSRGAAEAIGDPWFRFAKKGGCSCSWFFHRAYRAGFRPVTVGIVGHRFPVTVLPGPTFRLDKEIADLHRE